MNHEDSVINDFYRRACEGAWDLYVTSGLARLAEALGCKTAAWWSHGIGYASGGELVQYPHPHLTIRAFTAVSLPAEGVATVSTPDGPSTAYVHPHRDGNLLSTVLLRFPDDRVTVESRTIESLCAHMIEAGGIALQQFIRRDDWLAVAGRPNRGSAALVDSNGVIYCASDQFHEFIGTGTGGERHTVLPFALPESVNGQQDGGFVVGPLHVRVMRCGGLFQMHVRRPQPLDSLSPREQEIARALSKGETLKSIAQQYGIALSTVANHTTRIYRKLAIDRREDLMEMVTAEGDSPSGEPPR